MASLQLLMFVLLGLGGSQMVAGVFISSIHCPKDCRCNTIVAGCEGRAIQTIPHADEEYDFVLLDLGSNRIKMLQDFSLRNFSKLQVLNLTDNAIQKIPRYAFKDLKYLHTLDVSDNGLHLHGIDKNFISDLSLIRLSLSKNIYLGEDLASSKIAGDDNGAWIYSSSLTTLYLTSCRLEQLPPWMLRGLPALTALDVSDNQLVVLQVQALTSVCRLNLIDLKGNMWDCEACENERSASYVQNNSVEAFKFCEVTSTATCNLTLEEVEMAEKNNCHNKSITYMNEPGQNNLHNFFFLVALALAVVFMMIVIILACYSCSEYSVPRPHRNNAVMAEGVSSNELDEADAMSIELAEGVAPGEEEDAEENNTEV